MKFGLVLPSILYWRAFCPFLFQNAYWLRLKPLQSGKRVICRRLASCRWAEASTENPRSPLRDDHTACERALSLLGIRLQRGWEYARVIWYSSSILGAGTLSHLIQQGACHFWIVSAGSSFSCIWQEVTLCLWGSCCEHSCGGMPAASVFNIEWARQRTPALFRFFF